MISLSNIRLNHFPESSLDLQIGHGEIIALTGDNGAGKSTLLSYLAGLEPAASLANGIEERHYFRLQDGLRTAMVFQDPEDNLIFSTLREDVRFGLKNIGKVLSEAEFDDLLRQFCLEGQGSRPYQEMSSGERERAALASIVSQQPDLLLLDEALTSQSDNMAVRILRTVLSQAEKLGTSVILATHEPELQRLCRRTVRLDHGAVLAGDFPAAEPSAKEDPFHTLLEQCGISRGSVQQLTPQLQLTAWTRQPAKTECLSLDDVSLTYGGKTIFSDLSCSLREGTLYHLTGPSGAGKSLLLQLAAGSLRAFSGEVRVCGQPFPRAGKGGWSMISAKNHPKYLNSLRRQIGYLGQHPDRQLFQSTVFEDVGFAAQNFGLSGEALYTARVKALYRMEVPESCWQRPAARLSIGEQRKAALAGMIAADPQILLLDAPYAELDVNGVEALNRVLQEFLEQGRTILIAEGR